MKTIITLLAFTFLAIQANATTRTLNNAVPSPGQYNTWAAVQTASSNGDTILIQGTSYNYFTLSVSKRLVIIGPGHNPIDKQNNEAAFCDGIVFTTGSNGCKVYGLKTGYVYTGVANVDSITISQCKITVQFYTTFSQCEHWIFDGNVFEFTGHNLDANGQSFGDAIFQNNIFNGTIYQFNGSYIGYNYFNNNIFLCNSTYTFQYCNNFYMNNNIFYRAGIQNLGHSGITWNKNASFNCLSGNTFPNGTNYENVNPLFVTSIGTGAYFNYNTDYHLQSASPLINAGGDGTDLGVYGGSGDFDQYGVPHNPYIKTLNITGATSINAGDSLQIYIKAKVRN